MINQIYKNIFVLLLLMFSLESCEDSANYPISNINFLSANLEISRYNETTLNQKRSLFESKYKNHWLIWSGKVDHLSNDSLYISCNQSNEINLIVKLINDNEKTRTQKGNIVNVRFLFKTYDDVSKMFIGKYGSYEILNFEDLIKRTWIDFKNPSNIYRFFDSGYFIREYKILQNNSQYIDGGSGWEPGISSLGMVRTYGGSSYINSQYEKTINEKGKYSIINDSLYFKSFFDYKPTIFSGKIIGIKSNELSISGHLKKGSKKEYETLKLIPF